MKAERIEYDNKRLFIVFEKMDMNLSEYIKKKRNLNPLERQDIITIMKQITIGLQYLHDDLGIMHRDLKPENIMINENPLLAKIIDFGTGKDLSAENGPHTSYVSTRWYRAPECILRSHHYHPVSDVFALGCVMAEMHMGRPLFPGHSELD
jgi:serine/threonine protein kinase